jgi:hypothetical protein
MRANAMKHIMLATIVFAVTLFAQQQGFVNPLEFTDTALQREKVIDYIVKNVKRTYSKIGMDDPATLRMMEKEELAAFKKLTNVRNHPLLNGVIKKYCEIDMCNYTTISMMYEEELKASEKTLGWD